MAIDFDAIRRKLSQLSGTNNKRSMMWRPTEGEDATVRLLSFQDNDGQPFQEHFGGRGRQPIGVGAPEVLRQLEI